jgi:hypothetical protein
MLELGIWSFEEVPAVCVARNDKRCGFVLANYNSLG